MLSQEEIKLSIGEIGILLKYKGIRWSGWPHPFYQKFLSDAKPEIVLHISKDRPPVFAQENLIFDGQANLWKLYRVDSGYVIEIFDPVPPHSRIKTAFMDSSLLSGEVYIISNNKIKLESFSQLIQPLVEILIINRLSLNKGILVHGLGINEEGRGLAFIGPSGSGKSTLAKFYKRRKRKRYILSDEHLVIRKINGRFLIFGTPWSGEGFSVSSQSLPMDKIFFIRHAKKNIISPLKKDAFFSNLFPQLFLPFWDKERLDFIVKFCEELVRDIPCFSLGFIKDSSVIDFVKGFKGR